MTRSLPAPPNIPAEPNPPLAPSQRPRPGFQLVWEACLDGIRSLSCKNPTCRPPTERTDSQLCQGLPCHLLPSLRRPLPLMAPNFCLYCLPPHIRHMRMMTTWSPQLLRECRTGWPWSLAPVCPPSEPLCPPTPRLSSWLQHLLPGRPWANH